MRRVAYRSRDGLELAGDAWGDPTAPPVVFLPGGGQTRHAWGNTARSLGERGWYALSMDLRGHGESEWAEDGNYLLEAYVSDLWVVAESFERLPAVVGASLGGITGLLAAGAPNPLPLSALVLVDIAPRMEPGGVERIIGFMRAKPEGYESLEEVAQAIARYLPHREPPRDLTGLEKNLRRGDDGRYRWHWDPKFMQAGRGPGLNRELLLEAASSLSVPTLLVRGRMSDVLSPEGVAEFLDAVPSACFVDVSGAGHMVAGDRNDAFTEAVVDFLNEAFEVSP